MGSSKQPQNSNFTFLKGHDPLFLALAASAEASFSSDPNTTLIKLRQLGEALAQHIAALYGIESEEPLSQNDLLYRLNRELDFDPRVREMFHLLRKEGNKATHEFHTSHREAISGLRVAYELAIWFHRSFSKQGSKFKPGPFVPPADPSRTLSELHEQIEKLKGELNAKNIELSSSQQLTELVKKEKAEYEALALAMDEEASQQSQQAKEHEQALANQKQEYESKLSELRQQIKALSDAERSSKRSTIAKATSTAGKKVALDEEMTRILIDEQLTRAGWTADSQELTWKKGTRPEKGKCKAIAEWPTNENGEKGRADYVLFRGLVPIAIVEAKRENANVAGKITQAERYSRGFPIEAPIKSTWEESGRTIAWPYEQSGHYQIPFVYSCNGRPYVKQLAEQSGIWFRDVRLNSNTKRALPEFHTPDGLMDLLRRDREKAEQALKNESFGYLKLRDYQVKAIQAVENTLASDIRIALLAMATGTGKTRTIIGLMYRFLKSERFKRILFLVDRTALGDQATDDFKEAPLEQNQPLAKIYNIAEMGDMQAEAETRVQVATVQAMVKRIFASDQPPPVDQYDCIIVDEAHRGYTLDQEMTEGELSTREAAQYQSSYRRVLDYFDAVKVGLTATPAQHTSEIFGRPVYTYSYREAVADDWLIDHEPPTRYLTKLAKEGIHFVRDEQVNVIDTQTGEVVSEKLEDDLNFEVEAFNKRVINEHFNRVICDDLVTRFDPFGHEKTMIFCATDLHADMVKRLLDEAFKAMYDEEYNQEAVAKITGKSDQVKKLIRRFKNENYPNIAITVDLLTTGIDVPRICNLVFMRRVKSRILYEQMIGRATRRCDEIGKTVFRIYDPVDIYATLEDVNTMKPLVKDPNITIEQLVDELTNPAKLEQALNSPGDEQDETQADTVLSQLGQKLMRVLRKAENKAEYNELLRQKLSQLQELWGVEPKQLHKHLHEMGPKQAASFIQQHTGLINQINDVKTLIGSEHRPVISDHKDKILEIGQTYGKHKRPEDYLESFENFIKNQVNESAALKVIVTRPKDLTRKQLKEVKLLLDGAGYSEANLQTAVRGQTNKDIAASIIGHIRQAALGEPLVPFEQRVAMAMDRIYVSHNWKPAQRNWLERLAKQLVFEVIVDHQFINERFAQQGGLRQLDKILGNRLDSVLEQINDTLWEPLQAASV